MGARWEDKSAKCPFFERSDGKCIVCEGVVSSAKTQIHFATSNRKKTYKTLYCDDIRGYHDCRISKMLMGKYESGNKIKEGDQNGILH